MRGPEAHRLEAGIDPRVRIVRRPAGGVLEESNRADSSLGAQIEPIMILVLGAMILVFALGVFLPMWDLSRVAIK